MKKQILSLVVASLALTSALNADMKYSDFHAGVIQASIDGQSNIGYTVGYGYAKTFQNGVYFGGSFDFDIVTMEEMSSYSYGANMKLGYEVVEHLALYGLGAVMYQSIGSSTGGGFGYGAGAEYIISDSFATSIEYATYSIAPEFLQEFAYDYNKLSLTLKYLF
ncbi:hypothetical protein JHD46_00610 [Sulfurimonas sp. SAG-AH-194-C20]|nr:outer membrane beta-barrel protein [Sulfurimonas sp. SAG-AH-194-C20]MDF1878133.1 hypothetical protein [Sulfurimonas sp. SAG-AH-194-C20]